MKKSIIIVIVTLFSALYIKAENMHGYNDVIVDSIMKNVFKQVEYYSNNIHFFEGQAYIKCVTNIEHSNFLLKYIPGAFPFERSKEGTIFETINEIIYDSKGKTAIKPIALNSTGGKAIKKQINIAHMLSMNIYNADYYETFILPGASMSKGIYEYKLDSIIYGSNENWYKIGFKTRRKSLKLLEGYIYIAEGTSDIRKFEAKGWLDIGKFEFSAMFGETEYSKMLPTKCSVSVLYNLLNNKARYNFDCIYQYHKIYTKKQRNKRSEKLDKTQYFSIIADSVTIIKDPVFWEKQKGRILSESEQMIYKAKQEKDSLEINTIIPDTVKNIDYLKISQKLVSYSNISKRQQVQYSGLINPSMIGYTDMNGVTVRQQLRFRKKFCNDNRLEITPEIGYACKTKLLLYRLETSLLYNPKRNGAITLSFRNGNRGFSSAFIDQVNNILDSTKYDFDKLNIDYYNDYRCQINNSIELANGLIMSMGIDYNYRKPVKNNRPVDGEIIFGNIKLIRNYYADFSPYIRFSYTPWQQYYMNGRRKMYIPSNYPTITTEYAHGLTGVIGSTGEFSRLEADIHQNIYLKGLRKFSYKAGVGGFFTQRAEYFVTYRCFERITYS